MIGKEDDGLGLARHKCKENLSWFVQFIYPELSRIERILVCPELSMKVGRTIALFHWIRNANRKMSR